MHAQQNVLRLAAAFLIVAALSACLRVPRLRAVKADPENIETTLFLIGDAGEPDPREIGAPLDSLSVQAAVAPQRSIVIFLGDNVYPEGIPEEGRAELADSRRRLAAQVMAVPPGARGIFIPGNHDWGAQLPFGLYSLRNQERLIASLAREGGRDVRMLPGNGCPGPVTVDIARLRLIILDTQWWLHEYIVRDSASRCANGTLGTVTSALRNQVQAASAVPGQVVMVAGHHPLMSGGEHGGYCSITGPFRRLGVNSQDVMSTSNSRMRDSIENAIEASKPLVYMAGHDHNLQVLHGGRAAKYLLVSGAGSWAKVACAVRLRESHFTSQHRSGFMRIDVLKDRGVLLRVYRFTGSGSGGLAFSRWLEPREP
jgi:hypothetical protein